MTHPGGRWDREARPVLDVRTAAAVDIIGHAALQRMDDETLESKAWNALRVYPCHGCGLEGRCTLAYHRDNEGVSAAECERERRT